MLPNKIYNNLLHTFCFTLDPLVYFHTFESYSLSSSKIINISLAISLFADDFLRLQDSSPGNNRVCLSTNDGGPFIVIDSGASYSVTPLRRDFLPDNLITKSGSVQQLSGKTSVKGFGPVHWRFKLPDTNEHDILPIAHHIPYVGIRLFTPPQAYFKQCKGGSLTLDHEACIVLPTGVSFSIPYQSSSNLPLLYPIPTDSSLIESSSLTLFSFKSLTFDSINSFIVDEANQNITPTQKELLIWHWRLAHADFT